MKSAYQYVRQHDLAMHSYAPGVTYNILPEITNDYTVQQVKQAKQTRHKQNLLIERAGLQWTMGNAEAIHEDKAIEVVLLSLVRNKESLVKDLLERNWRVDTTFVNPKAPSKTVVVMRRNQISE